jgi:tetratricopeptide (TPR) repeat protein
LASIIQPYINLGRLLAARGECAASIEIYASLMRLLNDQEPVVIDGFEVGSSELAQILGTEPSIQDVIINVYVSDSIKAFLISKDYEGLIGFLDEIEGASWLANSTYRYSLAREARARAWIGIGEYNKALKILDDLNRKLNRQGAAQLVIYALIGDIYRRCRRPDLAKRVLAFVEKQVQTVVSAGTDKIAAAHLVYLLGLGLYSVQEYDSAYHNAVKAIHLATDLCDEVARLKCLMLLFVIGSEAQPQDSIADHRLWCSELRQLAHHTCYQFERAIALFWLNSGTSVDRNGDLQQNEESILSDLDESLARFRSLRLAGCEQWQGKVAERIRQLFPSHATGRSSPELPESINELYRTFKQIKDWQIGGYRARLAPALSAGG